MKQKLIILNNGLRDHRGHYFETALSIAEAARRAGLHPVLATHVECRTEIFPDWLEVYPIFCTDHWMTGPPAPCPELIRAPAEPYSRRLLSVDDVLGARATVEEFVASRFPMSSERAFSADGADCPIGETWGGARSGRHGKAIEARRRMAWCADRAFFYLTPPMVYDNFNYVQTALAFVWRALATVGFHVTPRVLNVRYLPRLIHRIGELATDVSAKRTIIRHPPSHQNPHTAAALENAIERPLVADALSQLAATDRDSELENGLIFKRDLERLLALVGAAPHDHVVLGTAHVRELLAVRLVQQRLGESRSPQFHLEFRHPLFRGRPDEEQLARSAEIKRQQALFDVYNRSGPSDRISLYTDTEELSAEYAWLAKRHFGVLPIPFRTGLIDNQNGHKSDPLTLVFLGDARDEKGFHLLPELIDRLQEDFVRVKKIRFLLQATASVPQYNPQSIAAISKLKQYPKDYVRLVGLDGPLPPADYYRLVSAADIVLLPYDRYRYGAASSGTLAEVIAAGRPALVPASSWMSGQLPPGGGETFHDADSLATGVVKMIEAYPSYRSRAEAYRDKWLAQHTPDRFVAAILEGPLPGAKPIPEAA